MTLARYWWTVRDSGEVGKFQSPVPLYLSMSLASLIGTPCPPLLVLLTNRWNIWECVSLADWGLGRRSPHLAIIQLSDIPTNIFEKSLDLWLSSLCYYKKPHENVTTVGTWNFGDLILCSQLCSLTFGSRVNCPLFTLRWELLFSAESHSQWMLRVERGNTVVMFVAISPPQEPCRAFSYVAMLDDHDLYIIILSGSEKEWSPV